MVALRVVVTTRPPRALEVTTTHPTAGMAEEGRGAGSVWDDNSVSLTPNAINVHIWTTYKR